MAPKPKYNVTKEMLEDLHLVKKMTVKEIASQIGCDYTLILYYLKRFSIPKLPKYERIEGKRFGRLKVVKLLEVKDSNTVWECLCDCGNSVHASTGQLNFGKILSCGCLRKENVSTHGMSLTRPYKIWTAMKTRCTNTKQPNYKRYGAKGITYDPDWETFENFWRDMKSSYADGLSIDRIDNSKGYSKENCRWATPAEQNRNMSSTIFIEYKGVKHCLTDLAAMLSISRKKLYQLHDQGLSDTELIKQVMR